MKARLSVLLGLLQFSSISQNGFTAYTSNIPVTSAVIRPTCLLVDNAGNKWIGCNNSGNTNQALARFNNSSWTYYSTASTPALPSNNVTALGKDNAGNIWIGTDQGLVRFTGTNFVTYTTFDGLPSNTITCIESVGSSVYAGTPAGMARFDGLNFTSYTMSNGKLPNDTITAIKAESANVLWLGGNSRLMKFSINSAFTVTSYTNHAIAPAAGNINCIYIDAQNKKWLGTTTRGAMIYSGAFLQISNSGLVYSLGYLSNAVYDICEGVNNGVAMKMAVNPGVVTSSGIIEFTDKYVYHYKCPVAGAIGNSIEKDGNRLVTTRANSSGGQSLQFYTFDKANHTLSLDNITSENMKNLDINHVEATIANRGDMHWNPITHVYGQSKEQYEVPKGKGKHSSSFSALWIGGLDNLGQLHGAARSDYYEHNYWPGPLDTVSGSTDSVTARNFNKIWKLNATDIEDFVVNFNNGNVQNSTYTPVQDLLTWPAAGTGIYSRNLAPFVDVNNNGIYDPLTGGDYPKIKGDQALYYIFNDNLGTHQSNGCNAMGIEIQAMAYAYGCPNVVAGMPELYYTTFYDYKIINRSPNHYHDVYLGLRSNADIGYIEDNYIGCDIKGNYGYAYNADNFDEPATYQPGYGSYPPAQGYAVLKGPIAPSADGIDNDNDGVVDEAGEECRLNGFTSYNYSWQTSVIGQSEPTTCAHYYNYLSGKWRDGSNVTCGGNGYGGSTATNWLFPGDPATPGLSTDPAGTCGYWTEISAANILQHRKLIISSGPFNLNSNQAQEITYAFVTSFDSSSATNANLLSLVKLQGDVVKIKEFYEQPSKPLCAMDVGIRTLEKEDHFSVYPNPAKTTVTVHSTLGQIRTTYELVDLLGKTVLKGESEVNDFSIPVADLNQGIYLLRLNVNNAVTYKKIVKE